MWPEESLPSTFLKLKSCIRKNSWVIWGEKKNVTQLMFVKKGVTDRWQNSRSLATPPNWRRLIEHPDYWVPRGKEQNVLVMTKTELRNQQSITGWTMFNTGVTLSKPWQQNVWFLLLFSLWWKQIPIKLRTLIPHSSPQVVWPDKIKKRSSYGHDLQLDLRKNSNHI